MLTKLPTLISQWVDKLLMMMDDWRCVVHHGVKSVDKINFKNKMYMQYVAQIYNPINMKG